MKCRFCGSERSLITTGRIINNFELYIDPNCGSIGVLNEPDYEEIKKIYNELFESGEYEQHRKEFELIKNGKNAYIPYRRMILRFLEVFITGRKMLEIGGGTGAFGIYAKERGWDYLDLDVSESAINFASKLGLSAHLFSPSDVSSIPVGEFDLVVMWEVLEHIYNVNDYLKAIHSSIKPGGFFLFSTPNYFRKAYQKQDFGKLGSPPVHINFFTLNSLRYILKSTGFNGIKVFKRRLFKPSKWTYPDIKGSFYKFTGIEESPTIIGIAQKPK